MTENNGINLKQRAIKEQDVLIYFQFNNFDECLFIDEIDSEFGISYSDFDNRFLAENLDIMSKFSMKNLVTLATSYNKLVSQNAIELIKKKIYENGEHFFSGENVRFDSFGFTINLWKSALSKMDAETIKVIRSQISNQFKELKEKDSKAYEIISKSNQITSIDNFLVLHEEGIFTDEKLELLEKMVSENPNILSSINFRIFEDEIFEMGEEFVSRIAKYPNISNKLIILNKNNPELFNIVKNGFRNLENEKELPETLEIEASVITYASRNCFKINEEINFEDLANCALRDSQSYKKASHKNSENYDLDFEKECDEKYSIIRNSKYSKIKDRKSILLEKYYGINLLKAESFCKSYIKNLQELGDLDASNYVYEIQRILEIEDIDEIDKLYDTIDKKVTPLEKVKYEYDLRKAYSKTYTDVLEQTNNKLENSEYKYIEYNGKNVKQIKLSDNFNLLLHSTDSGFKGDKKLIDNSFKKSWNEIEDTERHLASSCFVNQDFLGHVSANENGIVVAFSDVSVDELSLSGPGDIDSNVKSYNFSANKSLCMTAQNLPYNCRKVYGEVSMNRRVPDYVVIFDDSKEQIIENSYKAATEFDIPVIYIDKREIERNQLENLDSLKNEFKETQDLSVLEKLVSTYETNVAGWLLNRDLSVEDDSLTKSIDNERFREDFDKKEIEIYEVVDSYLNNAIMNGDKNNILQVMNIMQKEIDKYSLINSEKTPISKTKMKFNAEKIIESIKARVPGIESGDNIQEIQTVDFLKLAENIGKGNSEITKSEVRLAENIMVNSKEEEKYDG